MSAHRPASIPAGGLLGRLRAAVGQTLDRYRELGRAPAVRRLLLAAAGSYVGDRMSTIALIALSYELGGGALGVGGMIALTALPRLVVQGPAGALADRFPGNRLLAVTHLVMAVLAAAFALLAAVESLWLLYGLTLAIGVARTVEFPAFEVRLMAVTPPAQRGTANAVNMLAWTSGELIGPLVGGLLLIGLGATPLFLLNGLSFLVVAAAVWSLPGRVGAAEPAEEAETAAVGAAPGYRALLRRPDVALFVAVQTLACLLVPAAMALLVVRAEDLGLGEGGVGLFYGTMGVGTLIGGIIAGGISPTGPRALALGVGAAGVGAAFLALFGAAPGLVLALLALVLFALVNDLGDVVAVSVFQHRLPDAVYGRFISLILMATGAGGLVGALAGPLLAEAIGVGPALGLLTLPVIAITIVFLAREGVFRGFPAVPALQPEVVGHGMFGVPSVSDLLPDGEPGGALLPPRLRRLI